MVHLELHTGDLPGACDFYTRLCGWRRELIEAGPASYLTLDLGALGGGAVECRVPRPLWLPYVSVDSVERATAEAQALGAEVILEPREGPAGWRSVVCAPAAGELAFWQAKPRRSRPRLVGRRGLD
jgi:predicted enzyme related to lactoylglutathione lyase